MSMHHLRGARALLAGAATAALLLGGALGASADPINPSTGTVDRARPVDGVGSDTTQDLNNGLAAVVTNGGQLVLGSWDATGSATIQTRTGGATFARPNGSSNGVNALKAAKTGGQWQGVTLSSADLGFARSSSAPSTPAANGAYSYVPLAVDAVTYASATAGVPNGLTKADLTAIYSASNGQNVSLSNGQTYTIGLESNANADIVPFLPQTGSGTRSFFIGQLGLSEATLGSAVAWTYSGGSVQEHDGAALAAVTGSIAPFSIAQHIAQGKSAVLSNLYGVTVLDRRHGAVLHTVTANGSAVSPTNPNGTLNTAFPIARPVFTVVQHAELGTNANLEAAFAGADGAVYTATSDSGSYTIEDFGFGSLINRATEANGVTINGVVYRAGDAESLRSN
ncbi:substrate-binding domain-containing protein [Promicromonospora sp. NPDC090134]|uniref:substrate-binding domain-containing protein n=1 Tax=Promicromonospora sp. NPDC090134 TaxID=3364408 RepID=UPI00382C74CA